MRPQQLPPVEQHSGAQGIDQSTFHLARMLDDSAVRWADLPATRVPDGDGWTVATYARFHDQVQALARAIAARGVKPGSRILVYSNNRPEWSIADFATLSNAAIVVPVFAASSVGDVRHIAVDSGAQAAFVAGTRELGLLREALEGTGQESMPIVTFDRIDGEACLWDLVDEQHDDLADEVARRTASGQPDDVATIVYTSGTTGPSKGVMLTHGGFGNQMVAIDECWDFGPGDQSVCFLPLAHSLERDWTFHLFHRGCLNTYCPNPKRIADVLASARPNLLVSVPMLFEKVMAGAKESASSPAASRVMDWALRVGGQCQRAYRKGKEPSLYWRAQLPLADKLVLSRIRAAIGGNKKLLVSGGAPLRKEVEEFFSSAGILLGQGYGLTESGPMMTIYRPDCYKLGTVGFAIKGNEIRFGDGGEVLVRGGSVMKGYWNNPEATAAVMSDGWLHTGDVGYEDRDGFITITDRLKDLIVTANGKNAAPQIVEAALMADPIMEQAVVVGDARPCMVAVLQPSRDGWSALATQLELPDDPASLASHPAVLAELERRAAELTSHLAHHEQVRGVVVSHDRITLASGLVTATMKLRRRQIEQAFAGEIDALYERIRRARNR